MNENPKQDIQDSIMSEMEAESGTHQAQPNGNDLAKCKAEVESWKEKFLRVQADYDNFTKRSEKERLQWKTSAQAMVLLDLLPVIDDFDRALETQNKQAITPEIETWISGFEFIRKALQKLLEKYDVVQIPAGLPFDPMYHEAIAQVEAPDKKSGEIVAILQKGYTFRGQVLRPAQVSVAK